MDLNLDLSNDTNEQEQNKSLLLDLSSDACALCATHPDASLVLDFAKKSESCGLIVSSDSGSVGPHELLSVTHTDTLTAGVQRGDIIVGNSTPKWQRLPIGTSGQVLSSDGTDIAWSTLSVPTLQEVFDVEGDYAQFNTVNTIDGGGNRFNLYNFDGVYIDYFMDIDGFRWRSATSGGYNGVLISTNQPLTIPSGSVGIGYEVFRHNISGSVNVGIGYTVLAQNTTGSNNVGIGYQALASGVAPIGLIAIGGSTLVSATGQIYNIAIGNNALAFNVSAIMNIAIGESTLQITSSGHRNVAIGDHAGQINTTGEQNVFYGVNAGWSNTIGNKNTFIGTAAGEQSTGNSGFNTYIGHDSAFAGTTGNLRNVAVGWIAISAAFSNLVEMTALGYNSAKNVTGGTGSIFLGALSGNNVLQKVDPTNSIVIGYNAYATKDNQMVLGYTTITETLIRGAKTTAPDYFYGENTDGTLTKRTLSQLAGDIGAITALTNGSGTTANGTAVDLGGTLTQNALIDLNGGWLFKLFEGSYYLSWDGYDFINDIRPGQKHHIKTISGSNTSEFKLTDGDIYLYTDNVSNGTTSKVETNQDVSVMQVNKTGSGTSFVQVNYEVGGSPKLTASIGYNDNSLVFHGLYTDDIDQGVKIGIGATVLGIHIKSNKDVVLDNYPNTRNDGAIVSGTTKIVYVDSAGLLQVGTATFGTGGGSVTSFSAGNLSPLFTTSVATATTTPALTFALSNAGANTWFGNNTGSSATPSFNSAGALTKTDDTNVTLTLGGSPTTALLNAASLTLGWTGQLSLARGGTGVSLADPGANTLMGWDDTDNLVAFFTLGSGLSYSHASHTLSVTTATGVPLSGITAATSGNSIANGANAQTWNWDSLTGGTAFTISSSTTGATNGQILAKITSSGANAAGATSTAALEVENTHSGTISTNFGIQVLASNGTINYGVYSLSSSTAGQNYGGYFSGIGGASSINFGVEGIVGGGLTNTAVFGTTGLGTDSYAFYGLANGASTNNYGIYVTAVSGTVLNYAIFANAGDVFLNQASGVTQISRNGAFTANLKLAGTTSGAVSIRPQDAAGTYNFNLPITAGTSGYILTSGGGGSSPMTWTDPSTLGGGGLTIGTTTITSGTDKRFIFDNAGIVGESSNITQQTNFIQVDETSSGTPGLKVQATGDHTGLWLYPSAGSHSPKLRFSETNNNSNFDMEWENNKQFDLASDANGGVIRLGARPGTSGGKLVIQAREDDTSGTAATINVYDAGTVGFAIKLVGSQTADALQVFNSTPTVIMKIKANGNVSVPDDAYDSTTWNGNTDVPTKNAVRDKIESMSSGSLLPWTEVTGLTQTAVSNNGYITNNASSVAVTLPLTSAVGDIIEIGGKGAGGWNIVQLASQKINFGNQVTTTGITGSLASTNQYDSFRMVCIVANTTWLVLSSVGNITVA